MWQPQPEANTIYGTMGKVSHSEVTPIDSYRAQANTKKHEVGPNESHSQSGAPNKPNLDTVKNFTKTVIRSTNVIYG
jgi:hypothetical protein